MASLIARYRGETLKSRGDAFGSLARSIVGQQISVKAAQSVWDKLEEILFTSEEQEAKQHVLLSPEHAKHRLIAKDSSPSQETKNSITPLHVNQTTEEQLRSAGLSRQKITYLKSLAEHFAEGRIQPARFAEMTDEAIIASLCTIKGIGRWTAEMFLIFHLLRPNVLPVQDIGLFKAIQAHYDAAHLTLGKPWDIAERWQPWRTVATWYLWRSLDPIPVEY